MENMQTKGKNDYKMKTKQFIVKSIHFMIALGLFYLTFWLFRYGMITGIKDVGICVSFPASGQQGLLECLEIVNGLHDINDVHRVSEYIDAVIERLVPHGCFIRFCICCWTFLILNTKWFQQSLAETTLSTV